MGHRKRGSRVDEVAEQPARFRGAGELFDAAREAGEEHQARSPHRGDLGDPHGAEAQCAQPERDRGRTEAQAHRHQPHQGAVRVRPSLRGSHRPHGSVEPLPEPRVAALRTNLDRPPEHHVELLREQGERLERQPVLAPEGPARGDREDREDARHHRSKRQPAPMETPRDEDRHDHEPDRVGGDAGQRGRLRVHDRMRGLQK